MDSLSTFTPRTYFLTGPAIVVVALLLPNSPEWSRTRSLGIALGIGVYLFGWYEQAQIGISLSRLGIGLPDIVGGRIVPKGAPAASTELLA